MLCPASREMRWRAARLSPVNGSCLIKYGQDISDLDTTSVTRNRWERRRQHPHATAAPAHAASTPWRQRDAASMRSAVNGVNSIRANIRSGTSSCLPQRQRQICPRCAWSGIFWATLQT